MSKLTFLFVLGMCVTIPMVASAGRANPKEHFPVKWRERNGNVILGSVCDNYAYGSLDRRNCRSYAVDLFRDKCRHYTSLVDQSGGDARRKAKRVRDKFCVAYSQFSP